MDDKHMKNFDRVWAGIAILAAVFVIAWKASGRLPLNWLGAVAVYIAIMCALMLAYVLLALAIIYSHRAAQKLRERKRRRKIARTLWEAVEGLTLNNVGSIYGVKRTPGEKNRSYKRRILNAARTVDTVNVALGPAGGKALETIAVQYGIRRNAGETDASLRGRIMAASKNRKGGPANGLQNRSRTKGNS